MVCWSSCLSKAYFAVIVFFFALSPAYTVNTFWTGATDNSWHRGCNWNTGNIPTCNDNVFINTVGTTYPDITSNACALSLTINADITSALEIQAGGVLQINTGGLNITGTTAINIVQILGSGVLNQGGTVVPTDLGGCCPAAGTVLSYFCFGGSTCRRITANGSCGSNTTDLPCSASCGCCCSPAVVSCVGVCVGIDRVTTCTVTSAGWATIDPVNNCSWTTGSKVFLPAGTVRTYTKPNFRSSLGSIDCGGNSNVCNNASLSWNDLHTPGGARISSTCAP